MFCVFCLSFFVMVCGVFRGYRCKEGLAAQNSYFNFTGLYTAATTNTTTATTTSSIAPATASGTPSNATDAPAGDSYYDSLASWTGWAFGASSTGSKPGDTDAGEAASNATGDAPTNSSSDPAPIEAAEQPAVHSPGRGHTSPREKT